MATEQKIPQNIDDRPDMRNLNRYVRNKLCGACDQNPEAWKDVGRELMPNSEDVLSTIAVNSRGNVITCCSSLFRQWLQRKPNATWKHLIEALNIAGIDDLATEIEGILKPSAVLTDQTETTKPQIQIDSKPPTTKLLVDMNSQPPRNSEPLVMPPVHTIKHNPDLIGGGELPFEPPKPVRNEREVPSPSAVNVTDVNDLPRYQMNSYPQGIGVIINNKEFCGHLRNREGTDIDAAALERLFTHLGFSTCRHNDLTASQMTDVLRDVSILDHKKYNCLLIAILTHGEQGKLYGTDGKSIFVESLTELFYGNKCPSLVGKPKIFILQACRGGEKDEGVPCDTTDGDYGNNLDHNADSEEQHDLIKANLFKKEADEADSVGTLPGKADFLLAYSTIPGYVSWRNRDNGSYFITALINVFKEKADKEHLLDMLTEVNRRMAVEFESSGGKNKQIPEPVYTLQKKLYFNPGIVCNLLNLCN